MFKMKSLISKRIIYSLMFAVFFGLIACSSQGKQEEVKVVVQPTIDPAQLIGEESKLLLAYLNEMGDYVNSRNFPSLIKASAVYEGLGEKQLIIDIRNPDDFIKGHIEKAVNIDFKEIPEYFESKIVPFEYDKIILVSEDGQTSSYTTCLLRLMGYGNVYSMRWGMSSWNNDFAKENWLKAIDSKHQEKLETQTNEKAAPQKLPELNTGKTKGEEILLARAHQLFAEGLEPAHTNADEVFAVSTDFYIMNYIRKDNYDAGHIPGAVRYKSEGTLGIVSEMCTIPTEKTSVVYCGTGHNSEFITAYLRLFGYNAKTLRYGDNGFMYDKMVAERETLSYLPFTSAEVENYPYVK
jgi:rhodanese-related sulfurtransferase